MHIVFFDSGLGGLNPLKEALVKLPTENFIYFGDTANVPYGTKSEQQVQQYMLDVLNQVRHYELKAFVIACNTATSVAASFLREKYDFPIIGMEPAIKPAVELVSGSGRRVMLLATVLTLKGEKLAALKSKVDPDNVVDALACSELVEYAERLMFEHPEAEEFLRGKLADFDLKNYGSVVLGSTHFSYFKKTLEKIFPESAKIVDGNEGTVKHLAEVIGYDPKAAPSKAAGREVLLHLTDTADHAKIKAAQEMLEKAANDRVTII